MKRIATLSWLCICAVVLTGGRPEDASSRGIAESLNVALALVAAGDAAASIPYFRFCEQPLRGEWPFHMSFGSALVAASSQGRDISGKKEVAIRSSFERMLYLREAMMHFEIAERLAPNDEVRAASLASQGKLLTWVGSPLDGLRCYREATELSEEYAEALELARLVIASPCSAMTIPQASGDSK